MTQYDISINIDAPLRKVFAKKLMPSGNEVTFTLNLPREAIMSEATVKNMLERPLSDLLDGIHCLTP